MSTITEVALIAIGIAIVIATVLLISAIILRAAVSLYNRLVGGPNSPRAVPEPSFNQAMGIVVLSMILNWIIGAVVGFAASSAMHFGWIANGDPAQWVPTTLLSFLAMAIILTYRLPTRFMRALGVTLCHTAVVLAIAAVGVLIGVAAGATILAVQ
jgi:hypothetical protein